MKNNIKAIASVLLIFLLLSTGAIMFGTTLKKDKQHKEQREKVQELKDSLQVELLKKQLNGIKE
jgi:hypothetical protein